MYIFHESEYGFQWAKKLFGPMSEEDILDMLNGRLNEPFSPDEILDEAVEYLGGVASGREVRSLVSVIYGIDFSR